MGDEAELAGFRGRYELNGATVKLVGRAPAGRWECVVNATRETIHVKPENLVACGSQEAHVYERRQRFLDQRVAVSGASIEAHEAAVARREKEAARQRAKEAERAAKRRRLEEAAAAASATARTTDLMIDELAAMLGHLGLDDLQTALRVCTVWRVAARVTARNGEWQQ